jgi:hypothetical protein
MVLCLIWSNSRHLRIFKGYDPTWLDLVVPFAYGAMLCLFAMASALVFLPVIGLHRRMRDFKRLREGEFTDALERQLLEMRSVTLSTDGDEIKRSADRLKLVQALDPEVLKLSEWPFDRASIIKYAIAPVGSLAASFGKDLIKGFLQ